MMFEFFSHTADLGFRVRAKTREEVFVEAAKALTTALVEHVEQIRPVCQRAIAISASRLDDLLYDWLSEILYIYDTERLVFGQFSVTVTDNGSFHLRAEMLGEPLDRERHVPRLEVKAVTYHRLRIEQTGSEEWEAEVVVDL